MRNTEMNCYEMCAGSLLKNPAFFAQIFASQTVPISINVMVQKGMISLEIESVQ